MIKKNTILRELSIGIIIGLLLTCILVTALFFTRKTSVEADWHFGLNEGSGTITNNGQSGASSATISGAVWKSEDLCIVGKCMAFDGIDDVVTPGGSIADIKTIAFWVKPASATTIFLSINATTTVSANSGTITTANISTPTIYVNGQPSTTIVANRWQLVVITTSSGISANAVTIGKVGSSYYKGLLDEIQLYTAQYTQNQIKSLYAVGAGKGASVQFGSGNIQSLSDGLVGYWKMDEASWNGTSGEVKDTSGNGNNGTASGGGTTGAGKYGNGGSFDGLDDYISINRYQPYNSSFTMSAWFKLSSSVINNNISYVIFGTNQYQPLLGYNPSTNTFNHLRQYYGGNQHINFTYPKEKVADNQWHFVSMVINQDKYTISLFFDGIFIQLQTIGVEGYMHDNGGFQAIGLSYIPWGNGFWNGVLDEVRIYNRALSPAEVSALYNWAPGPIAHWKMDEGSGTSVADNSGNGNNGTWSGTGKHWGTGTFGKSGNFNGVNDYIETTSTGLNNLQEVTIGAWINTYSVGGDPKSIAVKYSNGYDWALNLDWVNREHVTFKWGVDSLAVSSTKIIPKRWYYVTGVRSGTPGNWTSNVYINGIKEGTTVSTSNPSYNSTFAIGRFGYLLTYYFNGSIDDVRIYNYARTQKQIIEDMNAGKPAVTTPLAHWSFDEGSGTVANNKGFGGSALNGSLTNMASPATATSGWTNSGRVGKALVFDGGNDYVVITNTTTTTSYNNSRTLSLWFKVDTLGAQRGILSTGGTKSTNPLWLLVQTSSNLLSIYHGGNYRNGKTPLQTNKWYFATYTYNNSSNLVTLYLNGNIEYSGIVPDVAYTNNNIYIGDGYNTNFQGSIDEVKIYPFALTEAEVLQDYNQGKATVLGSSGTATDGKTVDNATIRKYCPPGNVEGNCAPGQNPAPVGEWNFDEGVGSTVADTSGNGNNGTWNGTGKRWSNGKFGKAGVFNGSDDSVSITDQSSINNSNFTWSMWLNKNSNANGGLFKSGTNSSPVLWFSANSIIFTIPTVQDFNIASISTNQWTYFTVTKSGNGSNNLSYYLNGSYLGSKSVGDISSTGIKRIAEYSGYAFSGQLDQFRMYPYARTPAQIAWDYNGGKPIAHWRMDECEGTTIHDVSGNNNHGTLTLGASGQTTAGDCTTNANTAWYNGRTGKFSSALSFDGGSDYILGPDNSLDISGDISVSLWLKTSLIGQVSIPISKYNWANAGWHIRISSNGNIDFNGRTGDGTFYSSGQSKYAVTDDTWHHAVGMRMGSTFYIFVDGTLHSSQLAHNGSFANEFNVNIGRLSTDGSLYFHGLLDDVRIYNYALSPEQVKLVMNDGASSRLTSNIDVP